MLLGVLGPFLLEQVQVRQCYGDLGLDLHELVFHVENHLLQHLLGIFGLVEQVVEVCAHQSCYTIHECHNELLAALLRTPVTSLCRFRRAAAIDPDGPPCRRLFLSCRASRTSSCPIMLRTTPALARRSQSGRRLSCACRPRCRCRLRPQLCDRRSPEDLPAPLPPRAALL